MSRFPQIYQNMIDPIFDSIVSQKGKMAYSKYNPYYNFIHIVLQDFNLGTSENIEKICQSIIQDGFSVDTFLALHRSIDSDVLAGRFRTIVVVGGTREFISPDDIPKEMELKMKDKYLTVGQCLIFLIDVLERIHPFADRNRRVCSIYMNMLLLHGGYMPVPWNQSRTMWEMPDGSTFTTDANSRYVTLMQTLDGFYTQQISN